MSAECNLGSAVAERMLKEIWAVVEHEDGVLKSQARELIGAAALMAVHVEVVAWGPNVNKLAEMAGAHGAARVIDVGECESTVPAPRVAAVMAQEVLAGRGPDAVFVPASYEGRDIAARLSARLDRPVLSNVVRLSWARGGLETEHALAGGDDVVRARLTGLGLGIYVIRSTGVKTTQAGRGRAEVVRLEPAPMGRTDAARVVRRRPSELKGPKLDDAAVVVAGGRGLGKAENYALVEELAQLLHGAPGATRAIVDAGWVPYGYQIGQTGKTVAPQLYVGCGISGATQHLAGMREARHIVAINRDREAPMVRMADLGVIGDVEEVLPRLIDLLRASHTNAE